VTGLGLLRVGLLEVLFFMSKFKNNIIAGLVCLVCLLVLAPTCASEDDEPVVEMAQCVTQHDFWTYSQQNCQGTITAIETGPTSCYETLPGYCLPIDERPICDGCLMCSHFTITIRDGGCP